MDKLAFEKCADIAVDAYSELLLLKEAGEIDSEDFIKEGGRIFDAIRNIFRRVPRNDTERMQQGIKQMRKSQIGSTKKSLKNSLFPKDSQFYKMQKKLYDHSRLL